MWTGDQHRKKNAPVSTTMPLALDACRNACVLVSSLFFKKETPHAFLKNLGALVWFPQRLL